MKAVILAAGEGTRLQPFTDTRPKVMLPICNKPIVEYVVDALSGNNVTDIVMVVGYKKDSVMRYFGGGQQWGVDIEYVEQQKQIGTGHALLQAAEHVDDEFLVVAGDNIIGAEGIARILESHVEYGLLIERSESPSKYGVVEREGRRVSAISEKPVAAKTNLVSTGVCKLQPAIFDEIRENVKQGEGSLTAAIQHLIEKGETVAAVEGYGGWMDIVYPWNVLKVNAYALQRTTERQAGTVGRNVVLQGEVSIGEDTVIHPGCYIAGPTVIGAGCEIGPNVCIFPSTSIGSDVTVYPFTDIRYSVIMDGCRIGSHSFISHSVVGKNTRLSSHFSAMVGDSVIEIEGAFYRVTDQGSFIGDGCRIGQQVVVAPGRTIGTGCLIGPLNVMERDVPKESSVM